MKIKESKIYAVFEGTYSDRLIMLNGCKYIQAYTKKNGGRIRKVSQINKKTAYEYRDYQKKQVLDELDKKNILKGSKFDIDKLLNFIVDKVNEEIRLRKGG